MKCHLVSCLEPIRDGEIIQALCGLGFCPAKIIMMWDQQEMGVEPALSRMYCCGDCIEKMHLEHRTSQQRRYLYGVVKEGMGA